MAKTKGLYIKTQDGKYFYLDAVVDVSYNQSGAPTEYAVEAGFKSSDHYKQDQDSVTFNGQVSAVKFSSQGEVSTSLVDFEKGMTALKKSGKFFTCSFSDNISALRNCLFTSLVMSRSTGTGRYAIDVAFTARQVIVANQAGIVATPTPAAAYVDVTESQKNGNSGTTATTEQETVSIQKIQSEAAQLGGVGFLDVSGAINATQN